MCAGVNMCDLQPLTSCWAQVYQGRHHFVDRCYIQTHSPVSVYECLIGCDRVRQEGEKEGEGRRGKRKERGGGEGKRKEREGGEGKRKEERGGERGGGEGRKERREWRREGRKERGRGRNEHTLTHSLTPYLHSSQKLSPQQGITTASLNSSLHSLQMSSSGISTSRGGTEASAPFTFPSFCALLPRDIIVTT